MKKYLILIGLLFITTGCSSTVSFEFRENEVISNISFEFSENEYQNYYKLYGGEKNINFNSSVIDELVNTSLKQSTVIAYQLDEDYIFYDYLKHQKNNNLYLVNYVYTFNYNNFKFNYYLNDCFDSFVSYEDDNYYYYNINGAFSCDYNGVLKLEVKSENRLAKSNSNEINENSHYWNIAEDDNNIYFVISKTELEDKKVFSGLQIVILVVIVILSGICLFFYRKLHK